MRISSHDVLADYYTASHSLDSAGYEIQTYTKSIAGFYADIQPIGGKATKAFYGLNSSPAGTKKMFFDFGLAITIGGYVKSLGISYQVKYLHTWYDHSEAILEVIDTVLP